VQSASEKRKRVRAGRTLMTRREASEVRRARGAQFLPNTDAILRVGTLLIQRRF
jgi:hypothetical protein